MLGGADNPNGELPSYITGANNIASLTRQVQLYHEKGVDMPWIDPADDGEQAYLLINSLHAEVKDSHIL